MTTKISVLSHACLLVETKATKIIIDPWLVGTCYWRSWSNYPPAQYNMEEISQVDAVFISHVHWDHWHGPTLKRFFRETPIYIPEQPNARVINDFSSVGCKSVTVVKHGQVIKVGDLDIKFYQFGLLLQDAALVIRSHDMTILNANDAKLAGPPLEDLIRREGPFDVALRSHSSANSRICYGVDGDDSLKVDDRDHYFRAFKLFMDKVNPRFAVPFASNHTHLNDDVWPLRSYVSNPLQLSEYLAKTNHSFKLALLLPGSSLNSDGEIVLSGSEYFSDYDKKIGDMRKDFVQVNKKYDYAEENLRFGHEFLGVFKDFLDSALIFNKRFKLVFEILIKNNNQQYIVFDKGELFLYDDLDDELILSSPRVVIPNVILKDAVLKNMFHHAGISKRVKYIAPDRQSLSKLRAFVRELEAFELTGRSRLRFFINLSRLYIRRWREIFTYTQAGVLHFFLRKPLYEVEEDILKG